MRAFAAAVALTISAVVPATAVARADVEDPRGSASTSGAVPSLEVLEAQRSRAVAEGGASTRTTAVTPEAVPGELLVRFASGVTRVSQASVVRAAGGDLQPDESSSPVTTVRTDPADTDATLAALEADPRVAAVAPNYVRRAEVVPTDPLYPQQKPAFDLLHLERAWDLTKGTTSTVVAVIDSGIDLDHPDLAGQVVSSMTAVGGTTGDVSGHGTAVAGLIAAKDDTVGITGVAPDVRLMSVRVLDAAGNTTDAALDTAIRMAANSGADIINISVGGPGLSQILVDAIAYAQRFDVLVVASAGNSGTDVPFFPAALPGVISVGATDATGRLAWFSNHGLTTSLAAPGMGLRTTTSAAGPSAAYATVDGTSFSAPLVTGIAALLRSKRPGIHWENLAWQLLRTASDRGAPGLDASFGFGIPDASAALGLAPIAGPSSTELASGDPNGHAKGASAIGPSTVETISPEGDEDWFAIDLTSPKRVTARVTPPAFDGGRAQEMDPVIELYDPAHRLVQSADVAFAGDAEVVVGNLPAGRSFLRVRSYLGAASPGSYGVSVSQGPWASDAFLPLAYAPSPAAGGRDSATGDLNGDGRTDVVTYMGDQGLHPWTVALHLQQANGSLASPVYLPTHVDYANGGSLVVGDLDGDGDHDLSVALDTGGADVFWQAGGTLAAAQEFTGLSVGGSTGFDLQGDGDLEVLQGGDTGIEVLDWNAAHAITVETIPVPGGGGWLSAGDLNGDGVAEIVSSQQSLLQVATKTSGAWAVLERPYPYDGHPPTSGRAAVGNVTGDAGLEVVRPTAAPALDVLDLDAAGTALTVVTSTPSLALVSDLALKDLNADGIDDITVLHGDVATIGTHYSSLGAPLAPEHSTPADYGSDLSLGDIDGSGTVDVIVSGGSGTVLLRRAPPSATHPDPNDASIVIPPPPVLLQSSPVQRARGMAITAPITLDLDSTNGVKAATVNATSVVLLEGRTLEQVPATVAFNTTTRRVTVTPRRPLAGGRPHLVVLDGVQNQYDELLPVATLSFVTTAGPRPALTLGGTQTIVVGDFDGDGGSDLYGYGNQEAPAKADILVRGTAAGPMASPAFIGFEPGYRLIPGDFDADGYDDLFMYAPGPTGDRLALGPLPLEDQRPITNVYGTYQPIAGDFDGDGYDDLFFYAPGTAADSIWWGGVSGLGASRTTKPVNGSFRPAVGDFNGDGVDDILWHSPSAAGDYVWHGRSNRTFSSTVLAISGAVRPLATDVDGDGDDDLVLYVAGSGADKLLLASPTGFTTRPVGISGTYLPVAGDVDGDGRGDIVWYAPGPAADFTWYGKAGGIGP